MYIQWKNDLLLDSQVHCVTETCESKTCSIGFKLLKELSYEANQCCPTEYCVPVSENCEQVVKPSCGPYQKVSMVPGTENCPKFVCGKELYIVIYFVGVNTSQISRMCWLSSSQCNWWGTFGGWTVWSSQLRMLHHSTEGLCQGKMWTTRGLLRKLS